MTPKQFAALGIAAAVCLAAAITVYSTSAPWTRAAPNGVALFEALRTGPPEISRIEVQQSGTTLTLERKGDDWLLNDSGGFPAAPEKVRSFLISLTEADLVEAKTNRKDLYPLLALENPEDENVASRLVRIIDAKGDAIAEAIIGKKRVDAFGSGKAGTYVRRPGQAQSWLVDTEIDAGTSLRDWVKPRLFETRRRDIKRLSVVMPDKEDLSIVLAADGREHVLEDIPEGMKIKYVNAIDDIADAARAFDFDDVRKLTATPTGDKVSTVTLELANELKCVFRIRRDGGVAWLSLEASGEGEAAKEAEQLNARSKGWEFRIPRSKAESILQDRNELLEKIAS